MASIKTPICTPSKTYRHLLLSPNSKSKYCIICGKEPERSQYKRKLYKDGDKTIACKQIEALFSTVIDSSTTNTVCKWCLASVDTATNKTKNLLAKYKNTKEDLLKKLGKDFTKRLTKSPAKRDKKRSKVLSWGEENKENTGSAQSGSQSKDTGSIQHHNSFWDVVPIEAEVPAEFQCGDSIPPAAFQEKKLQVKSRSSQTEQDIPSSNVKFQYVYFFSKQF